jgi:hypothetical protein
MIGQRLGNREGEHEKNIDDNEKDLEKPLGDQPPDAETGIDDQGRKERKLSQQEFQRIIQ